MARAINEAKKVVVARVDENVKDKAMKEERVLAKLVEEGNPKEMKLYVPVARLVKKFKALLMDVVKAKSVDEGEAMGIE